MNNNNNSLVYNAPNVSDSVVLGTLEGPCADVINPTRNGRKYDDPLWENVFYKNEIVKEHFDNGGIFGELGHPTDRNETDMEKIALCMKNPPVKNKQGLLVGRWDILNTPNGKILKTLVDYGYKIGISSRGSGDVYDGVDGEEHVDENTYDFQAFDAVLLPAVKAARLTPVHESLGQKTLKQSLTEQLKSVGDKERQIMVETLSNLNIDYSTDKVNNIDEEVIKEKVLTSSIKTSDTGLDEMIKNLQEALLAKSDLEKQILTLQNNLAVSDTKVIKLNEELHRYKTSTIKLSNLASNGRKLQKENQSLKEQFKENNNKIKSLNSKVKTLSEKLTTTKDSNRLLENVKSKENIKIKELNESLNKQKLDYETQINSLNEKIIKLDESNKTNINEVSTKLNNTKSLAEKYKKLANSTVSRYIKSKATMVGVSVEDVKNRLGESYSLEDIDRVCEDLQDYKVNISKLPFNIDRGIKRVTVKESKNEGLKFNSNFDDEIDDSLLSLAGLK